MNAYTATVPQLQTSALIREFTPPQITGTASDYTPAGNETYNVWRLSTDASRDITGMAGGLYGTGEKVRLLLNIGTQNIVLKHENVGSAAPNRFTLTNNQDQTINPNDCALCRYDVTSSRWRVLLGLDYAAIVALAARMATAEGAITTLQGRVTTAEGFITTLQGIAIDHESRVLSLEASRTADEARITALETSNELINVVASAGQQLTSNSTTFQNITGLKLTLPANSVWHFTMTMITLSSVAADFKYQFTIPGASALFFSTSVYTDAAGVTQAIGSANAATPLTVAGAGANNAIEISGTVIIGTAGDLQLQAAQNTATVETTDFVVGRSSIIAKRVA